MKDSRLFFRVEVVNDRPETILKGVNSGIYRADGKNIALSRIFTNGELPEDPSSHPLPHHDLKLRVYWKDYEGRSALGTSVLFFGFKSLELLHEWFYDNAGKLDCEQNGLAHIVVYRITKTGKLFHGTNQSIAEWKHARKLAVLPLTQTEFDINNYTKFEPKPEVCEVCGYEKCRCDELYGD